MEGWEEAIERCVDAVEDLVGPMTDARKARGLMEERDRLTRISAPPTG